MIRPTFKEIQETFPGLAYTEIYYAVSVSSAVGPLDDKQAIFWNGAYGAAIYSALVKTFWPFMRINCFRELFVRISAMIPERMTVLIDADVNTPVTIWRVLLADETYIVLDGSPCIFKLIDFEEVQAIPPPISTVSVDLTAVWFDMCRKLKGVRHDDYTHRTDAGVQQDVHTANVDEA